MVNFANLTDPTLTQTQDTTPATILPQPQILKKQYDSFVENLPKPVDNSFEELTPEGFSDQNEAFPAVPEVKSMQLAVKSMQNDPFSGYDLSSYNTKNPKYFPTLRAIYAKIPDFSDTKAVDNYIQAKFKGSKLSAQMFVNATKPLEVDPRLLAAITQYESHFGLSPRAIKNFNATGYGALDSGKTRQYRDFQDNLNHTAGNLARRKN